MITSLLVVDALISAPAEQANKLKVKVNISYIHILICDFYSFWSLLCDMVEITAKRHLERKSFARKIFYLDS